MSKNRNRKTSGDTPVPNAPTKPLEVTGSHISVLTQYTFPVLLRRLLNAEAQANGLPPDGVHVASQTTTPDGGEDGRIIWSGGPDRTPYLPARFCQFQLKAGKISPSAAAKDVLTKSGAVKDMVRDALGNKAVYLMLSTQSHVQQEILSREKSIRCAIRKTGLSIEDEQIVFRDADQIADWANQYPSVATWILEQTQSGLPGPFHSWSHWADRYEHASSLWVEDERLPSLRTHLRATAVQPQSVTRVVGLSGIGKSRLILEALSPADEDASLSDIVLYAVESEVEPASIKHTVQSCADNGMRAVMVVDECTSETRQQLVNIIGRSSSQLSLITIEDEIPEGLLSEGIVKVDEASVSVIESIVDNASPGLPTEDHHRLVHFSNGFPKIALLVCECWREDKPLAYATERELVDRFVLGRNPYEPDMTLKVAKLLAAFGVVRFKDSDRHLMSEIASLGCGLSEDDCHAAVRRLVDRGIAKSYGRDVALQPRTIALRLAEYQWREWQPASWDHALAGETSLMLKVMAARQLALLNTTDFAKEVVQHVCRPDGLLHGWPGISKLGHAQVLTFLAEINPATVADLIERSLDNGDLTAVVGDVRRHLVHALAIISFDCATFEDGARLLLRLAVYENEPWGSNATGQFKSLFPLRLGNTAAGAEARLAVLEEAASSSDLAQRLIAVEALIEGAETHFFSRSVGPETHGARPALEPWQPKTWGDARDYVRRCVEMLAVLAQRKDEAGTKAYVGLAQKLRSLIAFGLIDTVENVVRQICSTLDGYWPEALESLGLVIRHNADGLDNDVLDRVRTLVPELEPESPAVRVRLLVTEMPWNYPSDEDLDFDERYKRQLEIVRDLAAKLVAQPTILAELLPQLSQGNQLMAAAFGQGIAEFADTPLDWLTPIKTAVAQAPDADRNSDLLAGYLVGLSNVEPEVVAAFKKEAAGSLEFAPALPLICGRLGIEASDIPLVISALKSEFLSPWSLRQWRVGGVLAKLPESTIAPFFDVMFDLNGETYTVGLELLGRYVYYDTNRLNDLRPQVLKAAENVEKGPQPQGPQIGDHDFEQVMIWMLNKGRDDVDACDTARVLAKKLISVVKDGNIGFIKPVLPSLLAGFSEVVWPLIGHAIVSDPQRVEHFRDVLGDMRMGEKKEPVILHLPEDTLFAWCHAHPEVAPAFVASLVPVLTSAGANAEQELHAVTRRLLEEFGDRDDVLDGFTNNILTFSGSGSMASYYARYQGPLKKLQNHSVPNVRNWAKKTLRWLEQAIKEAHDEYEERQAKWDV